MTNASNPLTPREQAVLRLIAVGLRSTEIAAQLGVTRDTVTYCRRQVRRKLGAQTTQQAVVLALRHRWMHAEEGVEERP